ncbi:hypothetical protein JOM56_013392 [Amanita muscaria]
MECPEWVRIGQRRVLRDVGGLACLERYAGDLAMVTKHHGSQTVQLIVIPRLPVPVKQSGQPTEERRKLQKAGAHRYSPKMYWCPSKYLALWEDPPDSGCFRFDDQRQCQDEYILPFAIFTEVPIATLVTANARPTYEELNLFSEGVDVGMRELKLAVVPVKFIHSSYEMHLGTPLEPGHRVEVDTHSGILTGYVAGTEVNGVDVRIEGVDVPVTFELKRVRQVYAEGDSVRVFSSKSPYYKREGWVLHVHKNSLDVLDWESKEELSVKPRELVPFDAAIVRAQRAVHVKDTVQVTSPTSAFYGRRGTVHRVAEPFVEVIECQSGQKGPGPGVIDDMMKFTVPPWFLAVGEGPGLHRDDAERRGHEATLIRGYDRHQQLVNTWVVIGGRHHEKGLWGRIKMHVGRHIMHVELQSGSRMVDVHVNSLFPLDSGGRDPWDYHEGQMTVQPVEYRRAPRGPQAPLSEGQAQIQSTTPMPEEPADPAPCPTVSYGSQVLPANWVLKNGLAERRIWAYIRNSRPDPFIAGKSGFSRGTYEGDRALILGLNAAGTVDVHIKKRAMAIPCCFLFLEQPTTKGQTVVVTSGERVGIVVRTPGASSADPLGTTLISQTSISIQKYLEDLLLKEAIEGSLSECEWSDNEELAIYGPLSEISDSDGDEPQKPAASPIAPKICEIPDGEDDEPQRLAPSASTCTEASAGPAEMTRAQKKLERELRHRAVKKRNRGETRKRVRGEVGMKGVVYKKRRVEAAKNAFQLSGHRVWLFRQEGRSQRCAKRGVLKGGVG